MHCEQPPCVDVCPTGASFLTSDGVVEVDYPTCINCGSCIPACPYGARILNKVRSNYFLLDQQAPYEAYGEQRVNVVEKCNFCHDRVKDGLKPACVINCPGGARYFGDLDDPESDVSKRIAWGDAVQIDDTAFYYVPVNGMPESVYPTAANLALGENYQQKREDEGINPVAATAGIVGVAVVAAGIGVGLKNARNNSAEVDKDE